MTAILLPRPRLPPEHHPLCLSPARHTERCSVPPQLPSGDTRPLLLPHCCPLTGTPRTIRHHPQRRSTAAPARYPRHSRRRSCAPSPLSPVPPPPQPRAPRPGSRRSAAGPGAQRGEGPPQPCASLRGSADSGSGEVGSGGAQQHRERSSTGSRPADPVPGRPRRGTAKFAGQCRRGGLGDGRGAQRCGAGRSVGRGRERCGAGRGQEKCGAGRVGSGRVGAGSHAVRVGAGRALTVCWRSGMPMRTTMAPGAGSSMRAGAASLGERGPAGPRIGSRRVSSRRPEPGSPAEARGCRSGGGGGSGGGDSGLSCLLPAGLRGMLRAARRGGRHRHRHRGPRSQPPRGPCGRQAVSRDRAVHPR